MQVSLTQGKGDQRSRRPARTITLGIYSHVSPTLRLAWGAWTELGVSGWTRTHADWAIDLEPLLVFAASLGDLDPRLRDEVTDWCALNWRLVSKARVKNLLPTHPDPTRLAFGEFAATVGAHSHVTWSAATQARPFTRTLRSSMPDLTRPSAVWLRLRAMFGIGARAEVIRVLLSAPLGPLGIARIACIKPVREGGVEPVLAVAADLRDHVVAGQRSLPGRRRTTKDNDSGGRCSPWEH